MSESNQKIGVFIVDDHPAVREGLRGIIDSSVRYKVVGTAASAEEAVSRLVDGIDAPSLVRLVVSDISMKGRSGIDLARDLRGARPDISCVMISVSIRFDSIVEALNAGARGYLGKDQSSDAILRCLDSVSRGELGMEGDVLGVFAKHAVRLSSSESQLERSRYDALTPREKEVFRLTALNRSAKEIAATFELSEKTIENVRSSIMGKIGIHDRFELYRYAFRIGIVEE